MKFQPRTGERSRGKPCVSPFALVGLAVLLGALWAESARAATPEIRYLYDPKGQIVGLVTSDGAVATWNWDENSNLLGVGRIAAPTGDMGISLVSPNQGRPADIVEIFGKGLANPSAVTFNNVAAVVQESSGNYIRTSVPSTATTGRIHVVTPAGQADSPSDFTVLSSTPFTLTPSQALVLPNQTQQFTASGPATWSVDLIPDGNPQVGTISPAGLYRAPSTGSFPRQVTVRAQSQADPVTQAEAVVEIIASPGARALGVSFGKSPAPTETAPVAAPRVSFGRDPAPTDVTPLAASLLAFAREPVVTAVLDPATGQPARFPRGTPNQDVRLLGAGFASPATVTFNLGRDPDTNIAINGVTVDSPTQITVNITIASGSGVPVGLRVGQVTVSGVASTAQSTGRNLLEVLP